MFLDRIFRHRHPPPPPSGDLVHWDESFSVGNGLIDNEHREIVALLNTLYDDWRSGTHHLDVTRALRRLDGTARIHFSNEEEVLARHRCPTLAEHQAEHAALLAELADIAADLPLLDSDKAEEVVTRFVRRMVLDHILNTDMDAKRFLQE